MPAPIIAGLDCRAVPFTHMQVLASVDRVNWWHIFDFTLTIPAEDRANVPGKVCSSHVQNVAAALVAPVSARPVYSRAGCTSPCAVQRQLYTDCRWWR
jgi:hypothetical protein